MDNTHGYTKDADYYFDDGNCVLRIDNCLFNLHRTILRRSSTFFRNMLSSSQPREGGANGDSDDHPIVCQDSLEAFRAWCWALYAGIEDLGDDNSTDTGPDEEKCAHIGLLAHKYGCAAIGGWAQEALVQRLSRDDHSDDSSTSISPARLEYILKVSTNCNWTSPVGKLVENHLINTIASPTAPSPVHLRMVLEIAEGLGNDQLAARAYYHHLRSQKWSLALKERRDRFVGQAGGFSLAMAARSEFWGDRGLRILTDAQELCLYRGYISLSALRGRMRNMPEVGNRSNIAGNCTCLGSYEKKWKEHAQKIWADDSFNDVTEFLVEMKRRLDIGSWSGKTHAGGLCALNKLKNEIDGFLDGFESSLTNFFPTRL